MAFDWEQEANREAGQRAERLPDGAHQVTVTRVVFGKKDGTLFASTAGDPQIMVIVADAADREASTMVTLSQKAGWVLAKFLSAAGVNVRRMTADGVEPSDFAEPEFAKANLVGRKLRVQVRWTNAAGKDVCELTPIRQVPPADEQPELPMGADDEIPI